jgi:hypothetical protein
MLGMTRLLVGGIPMVFYILRPIVASPDFSVKRMLRILRKVAEKTGGWGFVRSDCAGSLV